MGHYFLKEMCVKRRGVGTQMLEHLEKVLRSDGVQKLYLLTARDSSAQAVYQKNGFYISPKMILMGKYLEPEKKAAGERAK